MWQKLYLSVQSVLSTAHKEEDPVKGVSQVRLFYQEPRSTAQRHSHWPANLTSFHYVHLHFSRSLCYNAEGNRDSSETFVDLSIHESAMRHIPDDGNPHQQCLTFRRRNFFLNFSTPVYKMWIIQKPNSLELWNKLYFEEEKTESIYHV